MSGSARGNARHSALVREERRKARRVRDTLRALGYALAEIPNLFKLNMDPPRSERRRRAALGRW